MAITLPQQRHGRGDICNEKNRWDTAMEKALQSIFNGAFSVLTGPLAVVILVSIIISLARRPPGQLMPVRARVQDRRR
jgi:hypothetical protein